MLLPSDVCVQVHSTSSCSSSSTLMTAGSSASPFVCGAYTVLLWRSDCLSRPISTSDVFILRHQRGEEVSMIGGVALPARHEVVGFPEELPRAHVGRVDQERPAARLLRRESERQVALFQVVDP